MHTVNWHLYSNCTESIKENCSEVEVICAIESRYHQAINSSLSKSMVKIDIRKVKKTRTINRPSTRARNVLEMVEYLGKVQIQMFIAKYNPSGRNAA